MVSLTEIPFASANVRFVLELTLAMVLHHHLGKGVSHQKSLHVDQCSVCIGVDARKDESIGVVQVVLATNVQFLLRKSLVTKMRHNRSAHPGGWRDTYNTRDLGFGGAGASLMEVQALAVMGGTVEIDDRLLQSSVVVDRRMGKATLDGGTELASDSTVEDGLGYKHAARDGDWARRCAEMKDRIKDVLE